VLRGVRIKERKEKKMGNRRPRIKNDTHRNTSRFDILDHGMFVFLLNLTDGTVHCEDAEQHAEVDGVDERGRGRGGLEGLSKKILQLSFYKPGLIVSVDPKKQMTSREHEYGGARRG
jgi:hypothetical protein